MGGGDAGGIPVRGQSLPGDDGSRPAGRSAGPFDEGDISGICRSDPSDGEGGEIERGLVSVSPWYDCTREHVRYIRRCRQAFPELPLAVEFRNRTWFEPRFRERTLRFLEEEGLIHVICDEPQAGSGSVPMVPAVTQPCQALIRFHGRNRSGWNQNGRSNADWRNVRYAYRYTEEELMEWVGRIQQLKEQVEQVTLLFNNNSRGDAAGNAKQLMEMLNLEVKGLAPRQLEIF